MSSLSVILVFLHYPLSPLHSLIIYVMDTCDDSLCVAGQKAGGQELVGGLDCTVHRNFFGSQVI